MDYLWRHLQWLELWRFFFFFFFLWMFEASNSNSCPSRTTSALDASWFIFSYLIPYVYLFNRGFNVSTTLWGHCGPEYTVGLTPICNNKTNCILSSCELHFVLFVFIYCRHTRVSSWLSSCSPCWCVMTESQCSRADEKSYKASKRCQVNTNTAVCEF